MTATITKLMARLYHEIIVNPAENGKKLVKFENGVNPHPKKAPLTAGRPKVVLYQLVLRLPPAAGVTGWRKPCGHLC